MTADEIRCPTCKTVDWIRDGFTMTEAAEGDVTRQRIPPSAGALDRWSCFGCGDHVPDDDALSHLLTEARLAHEE